MADKKPFTPTVSTEYAERLRKWQDNIYRDARAREIQQMEFLGRKFTIPPTVHAINPMSDLLGNSVLNEVKEQDRVLDMGTGSGVNAILAASKSKSVVAVDINSFAIECAKQNAIANKVEERITFVEGNVFEKVSGKFDLIIFDPPFRWFIPRDLYELSTTDENYGTLRTFFAEVDDYLARGGRILLCFGSSGDIGYVDRLIEVSGFRTETIATRTLEKEGLSVCYFTFRLTKPG